MIELFVALSAFLVLLYFSHDPPPNLVVETEIVWLKPMMADGDDSSYDNVHASDLHSTHTESEESVQIDDCFQESLSAPQTQHFPDATER